VKADNRDIGLQFEILTLSPFLNAGFTTENFNLVGKIPEESDLLHIYIYIYILKEYGVK
jgi:hypothetical protein